MILHRSLQDAVKQHGLGTNIWTIPFADITTQLKVSYLLPSHNYHH